MARSKKSAAPKLLRLSHPLAFSAFLKKSGFPVNRLFRRQKLPVYYQDPNSFVPLRVAWSLFNDAARGFGTDLGWRVGQHVGEQNIHANLLHKIEGAPTLYEGLKRYAMLVGSEASHLRIGIHEQTDSILFFNHYPAMRDVRGYHQSQGYQTEAYISLIRHFLGPHWMPQLIGLERETLPLSIQERFPNTRFLTSQERGFIEVSRAELPTSIRDPITGGTAAKTKSKSIRADRFGYMESLVSLLEAYMAEGYPSVQKAAWLMGTSSRTLARRLEEQGLKYSSVVDEARFERACGLLKDLHMPMSEISEHVGFRDPSHFARMFRRISGITPRKYRDLHTN